MIKQLFLLQRRLIEKEAVIDVMVAETSWTGGMAAEALGRRWQDLSAQPLSASSSSIVLPGQSSLKSLNG